MDSMTQWILGVPWWVWAVLSIVSLLGLAYAIVRDLRKSAIFTAVIVFAVLIATGIFLWEAYLTNHFIGSYDEQGLPVYVSNSGWILMWHTWPLWFMPTLGVTLLILAIFPLWRKRFIEQYQATVAASKEPRKTSQEIVIEQLEIQNIQRKATVSAERLMLTTQKLAYVETELDEKIEEILKLNDVLKERNALIEKLQSQMHIHNEDMRHAQAVVVDAIKKEESSET